jgi:hypothetical protein
MNRSLALMITWTLVMDIERLSEVLNGMEVHPKHKVGRSEGNDLADVNLIIDKPDISYQPHRYTSLVEPQRDSGVFGEAPHPSLVDPVHFVLKFQLRLKDLKVIHHAPYLQKSPLKLGQDHHNILPSSRLFEAFKNRVQPGDPSNNRVLLVFSE